MEEEVVIATLVAKAVNEARSKFTKDEELGRRLADRGIAGRNGKPYTGGAISAWALGRVMPPADAFLECMRLAALSLDSILYAPAALPDESPMAQMQRELREFREEIAALKQDVRR